jgi:hypothetical protein
MAMPRTLRDLTGVVDADMHFYTEHPADIRERYRTKLAMLPTAARSVYARENISDPDTNMIEIVETVLYYFDVGNRRRVAEALNTTYEDLMIILCGFVLGYETRSDDAERECYNQPAFHARRDSDG